MNGTHLCAHKTGEKGEDRERKEKEGRQMKAFDNYIMIWARAMVASLILQCYKSPHKKANHQIEIEKSKTWKIFMTKR